MKSFMEQLRGLKWGYSAFCNFLGDKGLKPEDYETTSTSDGKFRSLIEEWLLKLGFTFLVEARPWEGKAYYTVYRYMDFFDAGVDNELTMLAGLKDTYLACIKSLTNG